MTITSANLATDQDWADLRAALDSKGKSGVVGAVLGYARTLGARGVIVEEEYLDRDFTAEFSAFYSKVFKRYSKICRRIHFFDRSVSTIVSDPDAKRVSDGLTEISIAGGYIGYIVARPIGHAPLGRVVFRRPEDPAGLKSELLVRSKFETHVLGARLRVEGMPLTQQDARIGACAQASIWMCGRHFHSKHRGAWISTVDVTEAATKPIDSSLSLALPAGSDGLRGDNMVRALRAMGREPLLYTASGDANNLQWQPNLQPHTVIMRYVDSGIPVILGLAPWDKAVTIMHAVVAVGCTRGVLDAATRLRSQPTRAEYCKYFLVNDDQRGTNLRVSVSPGGALSETPYSIAHVAYLIVPLPGKVFTPGEHAEKVAWGLLALYEKDWGAYKAKYNKELGTSVEVGEQLLVALRNNSVVARTYLTYGWRYKQRMIQNICSNEFKNVLIRHDLPRYVWVTEFGTRDSFNCLNDDDARIFAHAVIDATSSLFWEGMCVFHAPGYASRWDNDARNPGGPYIQAMYRLRDDGPYRIKIRGA